MKIKIINGSQKVGKSNTGIILDQLNDLIKEKHEVKNYNSGINNFTNEMLKDIIFGDVIVLAFPLFADSIPSQTLKMLIELEKIVKQEETNNLVIYTIVNNGFYEGKQNHVAFEIMKNWCEHTGIKFGGGIGQGAGEMIGETQDIPITKGPFNNLGRALQKMIEKIELKEPFGIAYLSPYFPRFLWKFTATRVWHTRAHKNGINKKDIIRKL
jgi:multimeric flavodoxin WrbA